MSGVRASRAVVALLLLATACGSDPMTTSDTTTSTGSRGPTTETTAPADEGQPGGAGTAAPPQTADGAPRPAGTAQPPATASPRTTRSTPPPAPATTAPALATVRAGDQQLAVTEVARGLDTVWGLAWGPDGRLWFTERPGRLTRMGDAPRTISGVDEVGEGGLMGVEVDGAGRVYVMYTSRSDNRVVRLEEGGGQTVLVDGIERAAVHNGGRIRFGPDGMLYVSTGDAGSPALAADDSSRNGKVLRIDVGSGRVSTFSKGHRNVQGLCFAPDGRLLATEHGPDRGDEVNVVTEGSDGGWPRTTGNGIHNYTPTIAPAGCAVYDAGLIPAWRGSMLFVTLKDQDLRRLTFAPDGSVASEEVLLDRRFGRLRDVSLAPDGSVYVATSNRDGRGSPRAEDDRILRLAPAP